VTAPSATDSVACEGPHSAGGRRHSVGPQQRCAATMPPTIVAGLGSATPSAEVFVPSARHRGRCRIRSRPMPGDRPRTPSSAPRRPVSAQVPAWPEL
jgi:hypothetical protein